MTDENSTSCDKNETRMVNISGKQIDLNEVKLILQSHESVREAEVTAVRKDDDNHLLHATIVLNKDHSPSNELKLELAWHVGLESGNFSVFKDIEFSLPVESKEAGSEEPVTSTGTVHIAGHRIDISEVESALMNFDGVVYARVIGVPDKKKGEMLKAFVTLKDGTNPSNDLKMELAWHARIEVSPMIVFRDIEFGNFTRGQESHGSEKVPGLGMGVDMALTPADGSPNPDGMVIVDEVNEDGKVIHISSHRISTTEITRSLLAHPYVLDAAVVTVPDDNKGETMKAFVKLKEGIDQTNDLKLELAWHIMTDLKPISVFKSIDFEPSVSTPSPSAAATAATSTPAATAPPTATAAMATTATPEPFLPAGTTATQDMINKGIDEMISQTKDLYERVEYILSKHEAVSEAIVISVKDKVHGEALQAFVTLNDGHNPTEELMGELAWHARTGIGSDVVFKSIKFRRFFPVTKSRETLVSLLKADAMEIPTMMSISITD